MIYFTCLTLAQGATFAWDRVSSHTNLSNYILKYGTTSGSYTGLVSVATNLTTAAVNSFAPGRTYYFVVTARNVSGVESDPSNEISYTAPGPVVNDPPVANSASVSTAEDQSKAITLTGSDPDGDALSFAVLSSPANGTLTGTAPNLTYLPAANFSGTDSFNFRAYDGITNSATAMISITVTVVNDPPTLNSINSLTLSSNAGPQTVNLSGISSGAANENQTLTVTATSSNPALIPNPTVNYSSPDTTGSLSFTPAANASGSTTITVMVNDGQSQNNTFSRSFTVTVGTFSTRTLFVEAESGTRVAPMIVAADPNASGGQFIYTQTDEDGSISFQVNISQAGDYVVWCRVLSVDGGSDSFYVSYDGANDDTYVTTLNSTWSGAWQWSQLNGVNLGNPRLLTLNQGTHTLRFRGRESSTYLDCLYITSDRSFVPPTTGGPNKLPTLSAISNRTIIEDAGAQTVNLAGISAGSGENQTLTVSATSSNPGLIPNPTISYTSPGATGTLSFTPVANSSGTATITVMVDDGQSQNNVFSRTFNVTVTAVNDLPTLNALGAIIINEDAGLQTVNLSGIGPGTANESQTLTVTATSGSTSLIPNPTVSYTSPSTTGTLTFRPATNAFGTATITVKVNDGQSQNNTVTRTFTVTVNPVNDLPTISGIANQSISQGSTTAALPLTVGDVETPPASLTLSATSSNPTLVPTANIVFGGSSASRTVRITPLSTQNGSTLITVRVADADGGTTSTAFNLTVSPVNQAPTLSAIGNLTINEDAGQQTVALSGISAGAVNENQTLTITATSSNPGLIPNPTVNYTSPSASGSLTFRPLANTNGFATMTVTVDDGQSQNNTITRVFTVTVNPVNDPPTISAILNQSINQNTSTSIIPFTVGDVESSAGSLALAINSSNPILVPNANIALGGSGASRTVRVTPALNQFGSTVITITVADPDGGVNSRSFIVTVNAVNFRPTLDPMIDLTISEDAGQQAVSLTGISSGSAGENQTLTITAVSSDTDLIPNPTINYVSPSAAGTLLFTPLPDAHGSAVITVSIDDGQAQNNLLTRSFTVTVNSVNDAPTLNPIANVTLAENTPIHNVALSGISSGAANESQTLTLTAVSSDPALIPHPSVNYFSPNTSGSLTLNPAADSIGTATITVTVSDGASANNLVIRTFTVTVSGTNNAPTITDLPDRTIPMNGVASPINFVVGDAETPAGNLTVVATSSNPTLVWTNNIVISGLGSPNRSATVIPTAYQHGYSVITFTVYDRDGASSSDSFVLTVVPPNISPTLDPIGNFLIDEDSGPRVVNLTGISAGGPNENQTLIISAYSSNPSVIPHPTVNYNSPDARGTLTFAPASNAVGSATIVVTVNDGQAADYLATRVFGVSVNPINDPPVVSSIPNQVVEQNTATGDIPFLISDPETAPSSLAVTAVSSDQFLVPNANIIMSGSGMNRTISVTPASFRSGTATITILVADESLSASTSFQVTVGAGNTPPVVAAPTALVGDSYSETEVPIVITDRESRPEDLVLTAASLNAAVLPEANITFGGSGSNRVVKCRPVPGKSGDVTVSLGVSDGRAITRRSFRLSVQQGSAPRAPISVRRNGRGTVKPVLDGELLAIGERYSITALPAPDEVFVRWSGGVTSTVPSITFIMVSNLALEVTFTNNPYIAMKGSYNGLFHEAAEVRQGSSGNFTVTPTDRGTYTGKVKLGSKSYSVSGALDLGRRGTNRIVRTGANSLTVEFDFGGGSTNQVVGRVTDGVWEAPLLGDRAIFNSKTNPTPYAGSYTIIIPGQDDGDAGPEGDGFGTIKVDDNGGAALAGTLADGTKVSLKVPLSMHGQCPVYVPLYSGYGSILSWLTVTNRPADDITGLLSWIKPAQIKAKQYSSGFTNESMVIGSIYVRPTSPTSPAITVADPSVVFTGGNLASPFANAIVLGASSKITNLGSNKLSLAIVTATGLFKGSVTDPSTGKSSVFSGALLQKQNAGFGFLLGTNRSSRVVLSDSTGN